MKTLFAVLATVAMSQSVQAQNAGTTNTGDAIVVPVQSVQATPEVQPQGTPGNPIYILNNQRLQGYQGTNQQAHQGSFQGQAQGQIQEQPVSVVQDSPLKASAADMMRKRRQDSESATEDGIVQSLERARMDDELKRRDKFNNAIAPVVSDTSVTGNNNTVQNTQYVQQQPVQQVVPAPLAAPVESKRYRVIEEEEPKAEKVDIRSEIRAAIEESKPKSEEKSSNYIAGLASFGNYDRVINVNSSMGYGVAIGTVTPDRIVAEGFFMYGSYELERLYWNSYASPYPLIVDMRQYNIGGAVKYSVLPGRFRPLVGAVMSYTRRVYSFDQYEFRTSDAVDIGALFGADLQVSENLAVGVDFRYMTNVGYKQNLNQRQSFVFSQTKNDPERLDYYTLNLVAKFLF